MTGGPGKLVLAVACLAIGMVVGSHWAAVDRAAGTVAAVINQPSPSPAPAPSPVDGPVVDVPVVVTATPQSEGVPGPWSPLPGHPEIEIRRESDTTWTVRVLDPAKLIEAASKLSPKS